MLLKGLNANRFLLPRCEQIKPLEDGSGSVPMGGAGGCPPVLSQSPGLQAGVTWVALHSLHGLRTGRWVPALQPLGFASDCGAVRQSAGMLIPPFLTQKPFAAHLWFCRGLLRALVLEDGENFFFLAVGFP